MKQNVLVVNLGEKQTKQLASVLSNKTSEKILNALAEKEYTESDLAKKLSIPLSTIHYNIQQLVKAGLVHSEEYSYSKKGREINYYKLASKYIVIAPQQSFDFLEKLKTIIPAVVLAIVGSSIIHVRTKLPLVEMTATRAMVESDMMMMATDTATKEPNYALWFFLISLGSILAYILFDYLRVKFSK